MSGYLPPPHNQQHAGGKAAGRTGYRPFPLFHGTCNINVQQNPESHGHSARNWKFRLLITTKSIKEVIPSTWGITPVVFWIPIEQPPLHRSEQAIKSVKHPLHLHDIVNWIESDKAGVGDGSAASGELEEMFVDRRQRRNPDRMSPASLSPNASEV